MTPARLAGLGVGGDVTPWTDLGFGSSGSSIPLVNGAILTADGSGLVVDLGPDRDAAGVTIDGVPVRAGHHLTPVEHPNGARELDHVVLMTDSLERTSAAVADVLGLEQRRVRETGRVRQAFHRFADEDGARGCIVEIVERADVATTGLWGLVVVVDDLDAAVAAGEGLVGAAKQAVQPGRRIATVARAAGLPLAVAFMSR